LAAKNSVLANSSGVFAKVTSFSCVSVNDIAAEPSGAITNMLPALPTLAVQMSGR